MNAEDLLDDLIEMVEDELVSRRIALPVRQRDEWRGRLVYCVQNIAENDTAILLNRRYELVAVAAQQVDLNDRQIFRRINKYSSPGYLFNDGTAPWYGRGSAADYLRCLGALRRTVHLLEAA